MRNKDGSGTYFAAMNTAGGFKSYFSEIFGSLERLFIIKGGPGTGKSRLMNEIAAEAEERGYEVERFLCSSDPTSLDGIIISELSIGVIDGTSPHAYEASLPGAKENVIDLGGFWDSKKLWANIDTIKKLGNAKSRLYTTVYAYLDCIKRLDFITFSMVKTALDTEKLEKTARRMAAQLGNGKCAVHTVRIRSAISAGGIVTLDTYAELAEKRFAVLDTFQSAGVFMRALLSETDARGLKAQVSYDPFAPESPDAIYYPERNTVFYVGSESDFDEKTVNMRRFIDDERLRAYKPRIRAIKRLRSDVLSELLIDSASIKRLHSELEEIYSRAMDFSAKEGFSKEFKRSIFV